MIDEDLKNWTPRQRPSVSKMEGQYIDVVTWNAAKHGPELWEAFGCKQTNDLIFHFGWPQFETADDLSSMIDGFNQSGAFVTYVFADKATGKALGMASYMRIDCENGSIETGAVAHGAALQRTRAATQAHYLMARYIFDALGYRRYEWKLNNPNEASHRAAQRFGFTFEGVFRQHQVKPYGNRDTAWYSMLNHEWPTRKAAFQTWLDPANFDSQKRQQQKLEDIRAKYEQTP